MSWQESVNDTNRIMEGSIYSRVIAIVVALETYRKAASGAQLSKVDFAHDDAEAFTQALRETYSNLPSGNLHIEMIKDANASLTALEDQLGYKIRSLAADDLFIFYYAGHGFHEPGGNRLSAYDTNAHNVAGTSLLLQDKLMEPLAKSPCRQALVFVDACAECLRGLVPARDVISDLDPDEVRKFLDHSWYCGVFLSCSPGKKSYNSSVLGHGVWTYHLLQALTGRADGALTRERWLTDSGLRDYLRKEVQRFVTFEMSVQGTQTPQAIISGSGSFRIRHVPAPPKMPANAVLAGIKLTNQSDYLEGTEIGAIRTLSNFRSRYHRVPDRLSAATETWVHNLLKDDVSKELQHLYEQAKDRLGIRSRDLRKGMETGGGNLDTSVFRYSIQTGQNMENPGEYAIYRRLELRQGWNLHRDAIDQIFCDKFDRLIIEFESVDSTFSKFVEMLEDIQDGQGGTVKDDDTKKRVSYSRDGATFTFDLAKQRLEISFHSFGGLQLIDAAQQFQLGLCGRASPMLASQQAVGHLGSG